MTLSTKKLWVFAASCVVVALVIFIGVALRAGNANPEIGVSMELSDAGSWRVGRFTFTNSSKRDVGLFHCQLGGQMMQHHGMVPAGSSLLVTIPIPEAVSNATAIRFRFVRSNSFAENLVDMFGVVSGRAYAGKARSFEIEQIIPANN